MKDPTFKTITDLDSNVFKFEFDEKNAIAKINGDRDAVISAMLTSLEFRPHCIFDQKNGLEVTVKFIREP